MRRGPTRWGISMTDPRSVSDPLETELAAILISATGMSRDEDWGIYTPLDRYRAPVNEDCCREGVYHGRDVVAHQCDRRAVEQVGKYRFCKQHAKKRQAWGSQG